jgi:hypothetical protein
MIAEDTFPKLLGVSIHAKWQTAVICCVQPFKAYSRLTEASCDWRRYLMSWTGSVNGIAKRQCHLFPVSVQYVSIHVYLHVPSITFGKLSRNFDPCVIADSGNQSPRAFQYGCSVTTRFIDPD